MRSKTSKNHIIIDVLVLISHFNILSGLLASSIIGEALALPSKPDANFNHSAVEVMGCDEDSHGRTCCKEGEFRCTEGKCIPLEKVCGSLIYNETYGYHTDVKFWQWADCRDWADEIGCAGMPCSSRTTNTCSHSCIDLPGNKSRCGCAEGYQLTSYSELECEDIDECETAANTCTHDCINLQGSFSCKCRNKFQEDKTTFSNGCKAEDRNLQIFYTSRNLIYSYNVEKNTSRALFEAHGNISSLTYDPTTDIFYWVTDGDLFRSFMPGTNKPNVTVPLPQHLAKIADDDFVNNSLNVDWTSGNVYWLTRDWKSNIMVSKVDGRYKMPTNKNWAEDARCLVLDPEKGEMYWTGIDEDKEAYLRGASMGSSYMWSLVFLQSHQPTVLALDHLSEGRLYWADSNSSTIYYFIINKAGPFKVIKTTPEQYPISLDVFENYVYWATKSSQQLVRMDKFGRGKLEVLYYFESTPSLIRIYHSRRFDTNIRLKNETCSNQCSYMCLHTNWRNDWYQCVCPGGNWQTGESVCNVGTEEPKDDPLACNCNDKATVFNRSSVYYDCPCPKSDCFYSINNSDEIYICGHLTIIKPL